MIVIKKKNLNLKGKDKGNSQTESSTLRKNVTCFDCVIRDHVKSDRPTLQNKIKVNNKKDMKLKRAFVAWKDNEKSSSSNKEQVYMALIASHNFDEEENEVSDLEPYMMNCIILSLNCMQNVCLFLEHVQNKGK